MLIIISIISITLFFIGFALMFYGIISDDIYKNKKSNKKSNSLPDFVVYQRIVEDQLNYLIRENYLKRADCLNIRDALVNIMARKLLKN